jgi:multimeric flavodoxin WrbA
MHVLCLNCTLKLSPEPSNTADLAQHVLTNLKGHGFTTEMIRVTDHVVDPGVISEPVTKNDDWPLLHWKLLAADVLIIATPTWIGQPSSVSKRVLERMDAMLGDSARRKSTGRVRKVARRCGHRKWGRSSLRDH